MYPGTAEWNDATWDNLDMYKDTDIYPPSLGLNRSWRWAYFSEGHVCHFFDAASRTYKNPYLLSMWMDHGLTPAYYDEYNTSNRHYLTY